MSACPACRAELPDGARFCPACGTRLEADGPAATERKVVTTLFADLVGFTALGERHDPEDIDAALRGFYALARTIVERFGGTVEKFIGDAVVGLFGVPLAHEDDAERAVRAALELVARLHELPSIGEEKLQVRCAVNTGPALVRLHARPETGEGVLVGDAVNTCARLLAEAPAMGVVAGEMTQRLSARAIAYEELPSTVAKGKERPVQRWLARGAIAHRGTSAIRTDRTDMIGREVELALLSGLIDRAVASGSPQYALVCGEAGVGKSRLIRELFHLVDTRPDFLCNWRQGGCPPYGIGLDYWPLREIVGAHAGIMPGDNPDQVNRRLRRAVEGAHDGEWLATRLRPLMGLPAPEAGHDESLTAWTMFFESIAQIRPAVVVIEDLHWASEPTLEFLRRFLSSASGVPLLLVATARPEFADHHSDVFHQAPKVTRIDLRPLDGDDSLRLADALLSRRGCADLAGKVADGCGGNPLFAEELSIFLSDRRESGSRKNGLDAKAPTSILTLIAARLDALPPGQKDLLADAAVLGQVFWPSAVASLRESDRESVSAALTHLEQRRFLRRHSDSTIEGEPELSFWHALVRDVAYEQLPRASRAVRHLRAARWLEDQSHMREPLAALVAHHYETGLEYALASGQSDLADANRPAARDAFVKAGDRALRLDVAAAEHYYALAMSATKGDGSASPGLLLQRGEALRQIGRFLEAAELQRQAALDFEEAGDTLRHAYALSRLAFTCFSSEPDRSRLLTERAVDMLDGAASSEAISVLETWATLRLWRSDLAAVLEATERILSMNTQLGQPAPPRALGLHGYTRFIRGESDGLGEMEKANAIAEGSAVSAAELFGLRDAYARCVCVVEGAERPLASTLAWTAEAERRRDSNTIVEFGVTAARYLVLLDRWDDALATVANLGDEVRRLEIPVIERDLCAVRVAANVARGTHLSARADAARSEELLRDRRGTCRARPRRGGRLPPGTRRAGAREEPARGGRGHRLHLRARRRTLVARRRAHCVGAGAAVVGGAAHRFGADLALLPGTRAEQPDRAPCTARGPARVGGR